MTGEAFPIDIRRHFRSLARTMADAFDESAGIKHEGTKGTYREDALSGFLEKNKLPEKFGTGTGEIVNRWGLTQETAVGAVYIDRAAWNFIEHARRRNVSIVTAARAAKALGLTLGELLTAKKRR